MAGAGGLGRRLVIVVSLLAAGFFAAYLRFLPYLERTASYTDGRRNVELDDVDRLRFAVWDEPVPLPPSVNTDESEGRPAVSPDGRHLVFVSGERGLNAELFIADLVDGEPKDPRPLARLNGPYDELAPAFSAGALWFASDRPGGEGGLDLWRAPWADGLLGPAEPVPPGLNTAADETDPAPVPGSAAVAFASDRARGPRTDHDLYLATPHEGRAPATPGRPTDAVGPPGGGTPSGAITETDGSPGGIAPGGSSRTTSGSSGPSAGDTGASAPRGGTAAPGSSAWDVVPFETLNTPFEEREPTFAAGGLGLVFASDRTGTRGGFDLWRSVRHLGPWLPPEPLDGLNTAGDERAPVAVADGFTLLFAADGGRGDQDLHRARSLELFRLPGRPVGWIDLTILALLLLIALLAWLGRRWEALDILYKCLLVSLLVHLALMWWFREVPVEHEEVLLDRQAPTFKVRLAPSRATVERNRARNGQLDAQPRREPGAGSPSRVSVADGRTVPAPEPTVHDALAAPAVPGAEAPAAQAGTERPARPADTVSVSLADAAETEPVHAADAPELTLEARDGPSSPSHVASPSPPARTSPSTTVVGRSDREPRPTAASLELPAVATGPVTAGRRQAVGPPRRDVSGTADAAVDLAEPAPASAPSRSAPRPALDLASLAAGTAPGPSRRGLERPARLAARSDASPATAGRPLPSTQPLAAGAVSEPPSLAASTDASAAVERPGSFVAVALDDRAAETAVEAPAGGDTPRAEPAPSLPLVAASTPARPRRDAEPARPGRWSSGPSSPGVAAPVFTPLVVAASTVAPPPRASTGGDRWEHTPYRTRFGEARIEALAEHGGNKETERAVAQGLAYLASIQSPAGFWGASDDFDDKYGHVSVGKTGLCLLAFLGAGHTPDSDREWAGVAGRAVDFLLDVQDDETGHFGYSSSYSHAVTTYALAECYALTRDDRLRRPLERAVDWILDQQSRLPDPRFLGGWGYYYPDGRTFDRWPRTSVTVWQVMALESARIGGLSVPDRAFDDARTFLENAHRPGDGVVLYAHDPERLDSPYWTLPGSTPAGLFALSLLGEDLTGDAWRSAVRWTLARAPSGYRAADTDVFVSHARGNLYFWYYGSLALFRHGGEPWSRWNRALQDTLLPSQQADGSWRPISIYAEYAGDDGRDRSYTTALCVLTLEVYYRYFTPLLEVR